MTNEEKKDRSRTWLIAAAAGFLGFTCGVSVKTPTPPKATEVAVAAPKTEQPPKQKDVPVAPAAIVAPPQPKEPDAPVTPRCVIQIPKYPAENVPGLPTEEGFDEYSKAAAQGLSDREMMLVLVSNKGKLIDPGTKCAFVDVGIATTKVRILEGSFWGQAFFFPTEWTRGE